MKYILILLLLISSCVLQAQSETISLTGDNENVVLVSETEVKRQYALIDARTKTQDEPVKDIQNQVVFLAAFILLAASSVFLVSGKRL